MDLEECVLVSCAGCLCEACPYVRMHLASDSRCQECALLIVYFALTCLCPQITDNTLIQLAVNCPNIQKLVRQLLTIIPVTNHLVLTVFYV